jgi:hypothetical protein
VLSLAPFATKAFHIDDTLFLYAARQISAHPADPYGFNVNWYGAEMRMADVTQNGPLASYYIALVAGCLGWSELTLHLAFLVPAVAAVLGTYYLAARYCPKPLLAALATLFSPVFLLSSTTLMCDTMMLAFWVWAVLLWLRGMEQSSHLLLVFAGCLMAAAGITKYFGAAVIPLLLAYLVLHRPAVRWPLSYLSLPVALLFAYDAAMRWQYGHSVLYGASSYALSAGSDWAYLSRGLISLAFIGGCLATVIFYAPFLWSWKSCLGGVLAFVVLTTVFAADPSLIGFPLSAESAASGAVMIQFAFFVVSGIGFLTLAVVDVRRTRDADGCMLFFWLAGTFVFCWIFNWTINGRSILPMAPVASILMVRRLSLRHPTLGLAAQYAPLGLTLLVSMAVTWADYSVADSQRAAAAEFSRRYTSNRDTILFAGHWGFQYYMETYGFRPLDVHADPTPGSTVILPINNTNVPQLNDSAPREIFHMPVSRWLSTMQSAVGAGFYTCVWGPLPFAVGNVPDELYYIVLVGPAEAPHSPARQ